jgi:uncharacterized protein YqfA (UPF0365 family)
LLVVATAIVGTLVFVLVTGTPFIWLQARLSGWPVTLSAILGMKLRKVPARRVVRAYITCRSEGVGISIERLEASYLMAPGLFDDHVKGLVHAHRVNS